MYNLTQEKIENMSYVDFVSLINETNRAPGGKETIRLIAQNTFLSPSHIVLEIGCNTGFSSIEISSITNCKVIGIDPNSKAIITATQNAKDSLLDHNVSFQLADVTNLPFDEGTFNLVLCGGAIAWVKNRELAIRECLRVLRPWGFLTAVPFYYHTEPPSRLINELQSLLNIQINPWNKRFWTSLFEVDGAESYDVIDKKIYPVSSKKIKDYVNYLTTPLRKNVNKTAFEAIQRKAKEYFMLFNENHKYLSYSIMFFRKRPVQEQRALF